MWIETQTDETTETRWPAKTSLVWAEGTVDQFMQDIKGNVDIQAVFDEYRYYFGEE